MLKVSVVIPLFNKGPHIARTIHSVLQQKIPEFEIIVMDGNSTDSGPDIVKGIEDPRIHFFIQERSGVSAARNQAVGKAQADYIAFMDADDEWTEDHLATLLRLRETFPHAGIHATSYMVINPGGIKKVPSFSRIPNGEWEGLLPSYFLSAALGPPPVWTSAAGMRKEIFLEAGGFNEGENFGEDLDLWARIALNYPIAFSNRCTAVYHLESVNRLCNENRAVKDEPLVATMEKWFVEDRVPQQILPDVKEYYARKLMGTAVRHIYAGNNHTARKILSSIDTKLLKFELIKWYIIALSPKIARKIFSKCRNFCQ